MDFKDFTDLGNDIGRRVNDAVNTMNFERLSRDIRHKVDQAFGGSGNSYDAYGRSSDFGGLNGKLYHGEEACTWEKQPADFKLYRESVTADAVQAGIPLAQKVPGAVSGIILMITGYSAAAIFGVAAIVTGILGITMSAVGPVPAGVLGAVSGGLIPLFVAGFTAAVAGTKRYRRVSRFRRYLKVLKGGTFCAIKDMAQAVGKNAKFVVKDLQKMIERGFFPEGHIDHQKTCFIGTNEMYRQYLLARESAVQSAQEQAKTARMESCVEKAEDESIEQVIAEGEAYIKTIREANDAIYNGEISEKLYRMEIIVEKIFSYVKENPEQVAQLRRFMNYYMPTTEKLVNAYRDMDQQMIQGENITRAKQEIAQTLDTINEAYEKLYDSMYVDVAMDVSSDIAVLKTLFAQEGLSEDAMNGGKKNE